MLAAICGDHDSLLISNKVGVLTELHVVLCSGNSRPDLQGGGGGRGQVGNSMTIVVWL